MLTLTSDQGPLFELTDDAIRRFDGSTQQELPLADIRIVRAGRFGATAALELHGKDGTKLMIVSDRKAVGESATRYRVFVEELHRRIYAAGHLVQFLGGRQIAPWISAMISAGMIGLAVANPMHYQTGRVIMVAIVGGLMFLGAVAMVLLNRKRDYDPLQIPRHLVP